jgi:site-specific DNA-methyltransferase (adenine-specific)
MELRDLARRVLKPGGTIWVSGTHHVIFSLGFALQTLGFRIINVTRQMYEPDPNVWAPGRRL